jgi:RNA polymerase sigma factor (sigma-70 family)
MPKSAILAGSPFAGSRRSRLDEIVRRYYAPLRTFFGRRTRDAAEAQDLVQQVFLSLAEHPQLEVIDNSDAYVFQTAANALRDHCRRSRVRSRFVDTQLGGNSDGRSDLSPERILQGQEAIEQVVAALRELPERTRDIFMLRCFEGLKHAEIARLQGISVRAAEKHFAKALAHVSGVVEPAARSP